MKKILIPTDFSPYAEAALEYGMAIAKKTGAELILMHVELTPVNWAKLSKDQENLYPEAQSAIKKAKAELSNRIKKVQKLGIPVKEYLQLSDGKGQIEKYMDLEKIDLIIMGSHGQYGFKAHVLGSNTYGVIRKSKVPVLVVKSLNKPVGFSTLLFATDFKSPAGKHFKKIEMFAESIGAKMEILYINTPANFKEDGEIKEMGKKFIDQFANYDFPIHLYSAYKEERGIIQFSKIIGADLVAVITRGKTDLQQLFSPSITENLITYLDLPILSVNMQST
ncbi:universal stress protein [Pararhodonellum marinum]|uniref:universal stress protein n=1 Tax=Pararhodonellum marinum TaxID=2755358 RepID=UPI00188E2FDF|nr:universal stress protein [Pararhodonellum marinum]